MQSLKNESRSKQNTRSGSKIMPTSIWSSFSYFQIYKLEKGPPDCPVQFFKIFKLIKKPHIQLLDAARAPQCFQITIIPNICCFACFSLKLLFLHAYSFLIYLKINPVLIQIVTFFAQLRGFFLNYHTSRIHPRRINSYH